MKGTTRRYRRREDGVLEIVRPEDQSGEAVRGVELAVSLIALAIGATAGITGNFLIAIALVGAGLGLITLRLVRDGLAARAERKLRVPPAAPAAGRSGPVELRIHRS